MVEEGKGSDLPSKGEDPYNETSYLTIILTRPEYKQKIILGILITFINF